MPFAHGGVKMSELPFRVFWQPGCSSCVKVKEFLAHLGVPFESVNVLTHPNAMEDLQALGAQSIPIVSRGNQFVFGQSLAQVAEFIGKTAPRTERLPPDVLMARWEFFLDAARSQTTQIPHDKLDTFPVPDRNRSVRELAFHIFQVPHSFIESVVDHVEDWTIRCTTPVPDDVVTTADILKYADHQTKTLKTWWSDLQDRDCQWLVGTHYGQRTAHELLERQTWHSAQHARQLQHVMESFGTPLAKTIPPSAYQGLPMPTGLWE